MKKTIILSICLLWSAWMFAQISAVVQASSTGADNITVSRDAKSTLVFSLEGLPAGARFESCKLQMTVARPLAQKMRLEAALGQGSIWPDNIDNNQDLMGFTVVDKGRQAGFTVDIKLDTAFLRANLAKKPLNILLRGKLGTIELVNKKEQPGDCPKLLVRYTLPNTVPIGWASAHADKQHTGSSYMRVLGAKPTDITFDTIASLSNISSEQVVYKDKVYVTATDANSRTALYAVDMLTSTQTLVADNLEAPSTKAMPCIDPLGRLYYLTSNHVHLIDLANGNKKTEKVIIFSNKDAPKAPPTIGSDGALYLTMESGYAAYSPAPDWKQLWGYPAGGRKSPITLNQDGTIGYMVIYDQDSVIAINTSNGRRLYAAAISGLYKGEVNEGETIPMVDNDGNLYVPNRLTDATRLTVFDKTLKPLNIVTGDNISRPVMGGSGQVYWVKDGDLYRNGLRLIQFNSGLKVKSLVSDGADNIYCLGRDNTLYLYDNISKVSISKNPYLSGMTGFQRSLVMGESGCLTTATSSTLYRFRTSTQASYTLPADQIQRNNTVFKGNPIVVKDTALSRHQQFISAAAGQTWEGVTISKSANVTLGSPGNIELGRGFKVEKGATFSCRVISKVSGRQ